MVRKSSLSPHGARPNISIHHHTIWETGLFIAPTPSPLPTCFSLLIILFFLSNLLSMELPLSGYQRTSSHIIAHLLQLLPLLVQLHNHHLPFNLLVFAWQKVQVINFLPGVAAAKYSL